MSLVEFIVNKGKTLKTKVASARVQFSQSQLSKKVPDSKIDILAKEFIHFH
jgi:hypothetical protein